MSAEAWRPSEEDQRLACEGYVNYAGGVAVIGNPEATALIHGQNVSSETLPHIVEIAEGIMVKGISDVIKRVHPPSIRTNLLKLENRFDEAEPRMFETLTLAYDQYAERLHMLNTFFGALRPAPMLDRSLYRYICHGRWYKIHTTSLMYPFTPAAELEDIVVSRTLNAQAVKSRERSFS